MTTPVKLASVRPMTYGFGLTVDTLGTHRVVSHGGNVNGFAAGLMHLPDDSLFVAVLSNTSSAPSARIADDIVRAVIGVPRVAVAPRDVALSADERAAMLGRYSLVQPDGSRREVSLVEQDGHVALSIPGQPPMVLLRQDGPVFTVRGQTATRVFFEMNGGRVTGFILDRGSRPLPARAFSSASNHIQMKQMRARFEGRVISAARRSRGAASTAATTITIDNSCSRQRRRPRPMSASATSMATVTSTSCSPRDATVLSSTESYWAMAAEAFQPRTTSARIGPLVFRPVGGSQRRWISRRRDQQRCAGSDARDSDVLPPASDRARAACLGCDGGSRSGDVRGVQAGRAG